MNTKLIAKNPTAYHNYFIEDKIETIILIQLQEHLQMVMQLLWG